LVTPAGICARLPPFLFRGPELPCAAPEAGACAAFEAFCVLVAFEEFAAEFCALPAAGAVGFAGAGLFAAGCGGARSASVATFSTTGIGPLGTTGSFTSIAAGTKPSWLTSTW
jgi:hypothetical protein